MGAAALLERHARLLYDLDADGRIAGVNEPEAERAPRVWLARGGAGSLLLTRQDVPAGVVDRLVGLVAELPAWDGSPMATDWTGRLAELVGGEVSGGPAFLFPKETVIVVDVEGLVVVDAATRPLLGAHFPFTERHLAARSPVVGVVRDGAIVAVCSTVRVRAGEGEAGVHTLEAYRGQGFARAVVARWRDAIVAAGGVPFYSTTWDDTASLAIANGSGMEVFAEEIGVG